MMLLNASSNSLQLKHLFLFILMGLSVACTTAPVLVPVDNPESTWTHRKAELTGIKHWRLKGRMLVSQGEAVWNISIDWQQKDEDYQIAIQGPFGAGKVKLIGNAQGVLLKDADEQSFYADRAEDLLYQQTGVLMPVTGLRYWVMGLTSPGQKNKPKLDVRGRLTYLEESNWKVSIKRYTQISGMELPNKVFIVKPEQEIDVRLVVDKWTLGAF